MYNWKQKKRATGLEPVRAELNSAMLHQLHHARMSLAVRVIIKKTYWIASKKNKCV